MLRHRERALAAVGLIALMTAGCVQPGPPGVSITPLKADIVFGVKVVVDTATPANFSTPQPEFFAQDEEAFDDQFDEKVLEIPEVKPLPKTLANTDCPPAALTAFPKETAEVAVKGLPKEGVYRFKRNITVTPTGEQPLSNNAFESHAVRRVVQNPSKTYEFTYEVVQPDNLHPGQVTITTYRVNSNPTIVRDLSQPGRPAGLVNVPGFEMIVTPPTDEPGIFVEKIVNQDKNGGTLSTFEPTTPVKYLPLEEGILKAGQTFDTVTIDPTSGQAFRHEGVVLRKTRVDACGEIVEGWLIEATQTRTNDQEGGEPVTRKYFYNIATQLGSLFIAEATSIEVAFGRVDIDLSLANPTPQPLPDNLK